MSLALRAACPRRCHLWRHLTPRSFLSSTLPCPPLAHLQSAEIKHMFDPADVDCDEVEAILPPKIVEGWAKAPAKAPANSVAKSKTWLRPRRLARRREQSVLPRGRDPWARPP